MANELNGEVALVVGEKEFTLKLTMNKAAEAEQYMSGSLFTYNPGLRSARALLFVMVKGKHGINTIEDAGDLLEEDYPTVTNATTNAVTLFFQKINREKVGKKEEKKVQKKDLPVGVAS